MMRATRLTTFLSLIFGFFSVAAYAQPQQSGWLATFNTFKISDRFSLHFDAQLRSTDELQQIGTILIRPGLNFHLNKTVVLTAGPMLNIARRNVGSFSSLLTEKRLWQQVLINKKINKLSLANRFRFEERFIPRPKVESSSLVANGYDQAFRFRYFVRGVLPLMSGDGFTAGPFVALQNEVFINTGNRSAVNGKAFDQNRLYGAVGYRLKGKIDLEAGYMNQYSNTRTSFINNHIIQLAVYKRM